MKISGALVAVAALLLSACSTSGSSGSRNVLYDSVGELAADSAVVVQVRPTGDTRRPSIDLDYALTGTVVEVVSSYVPVGLGTNLKEGQGQLSTGDVVTVWQLGDGKTPGPVPLLQSHATYLLFLTWTELNFMTGEDFFVTGGGAGAWRQRDGVYVREVDEGDRLPEKLTENDLS